jgi:hypothetical protein
VIADPPSLDGSVQPTVIEWSPGVTIGEVGAPGTVDGIALATGEDGGDWPLPFTAVTTQ